MNVLSLVFGTVRLCLGILLFFKLYKSRNKNSLKADSVFKKRPILMTLLSIFLISTGIHSLFFDKTYTNNDENNQEWTQETKDILISVCMKDADEKNTFLIPITRKYCECSVENVTKNISKKEYIELLNKPFDEQTKRLSPFFQVCLEELKESRKKILK